MAKIVKLLFLFLIVCTFSFGANNYIAELKSYDKKIETSSDDEVLRIYHAIKNIYIHSIVNSDTKLKKESLSRLVYTSKLLKLDPSQYEKELNTIIKLDIKTYKPKRVTKKIIVKPKKEVKKYNHVKITTKLPMLKSLKDKGDRLEFIFDKKLSLDDVNSFQLKNSKNYREVFDIKAIYGNNNGIKTPKNLQDIRIAQYNSKTMRIVLQRKSILKSKYVVKNDILSIYYSSKPSKTTKVVKNPTIKSYKNLATFLPSHKIIVIDAGHGGKDVGAIGFKKLYEKDVVLKMALKTGRELQKRGYKVYYTRVKDVFVKLRGRTSYANKKDADLFISIHANATKKRSMHGIETFFLSPDRSNRSKNVAALENKSDIEEMDYFSKQTFLNVFSREKIVSANKLALDVQQGMLNLLKRKYSYIRDGGVREAPFWVLVGAQMPAILVETGYITNTGERIRMFSSTYQTLIAKGIADGIDNYFLKSDF